MKRMSLLFFLILFTAVVYAQDRPMVVKLYVDPIAEQQISVHNLPTYCARSFGSMWDTINYPKWTFLWTTNLVPNSHLEVRPEKDVFNVIVVPEGRKLVFCSEGFDETCKEIQQSDAEQAYGLMVLRISYPKPENAESITHNSKLVAESIATIYGKKYSLPVKIPIEPKKKKTKS